MSVADGEIAEEFYNSFVARKTELENGGVEFIMNDNFSTRPNIATNCIHAVSDLPIALASLPMLDTFSLHGYEACFAVYRYLSPWYLPTEVLLRSAAAPRVKAVAETETLTREKLDDTLVAQFQQQEKVLSAWVKKDGPAKKGVKRTKRAAAKKRVIKKKVRR